MLMEDRAVDVLFSLLDPVDPGNRVMDRFLAMISEFFFVWLGALVGIDGASSLEALCREEAPK
jgi:hypothetical protein